MELLTNFPLLSSLAAIIFAQVIKVPIQFIVSRKLDWSLVTSTGGMPSSHSAAVTALSTGVALEHGLDSSLFAVSAIFAVITMFDATGVRRHAGEQATVINKLAFPADVRDSAAIDEITARIEREMGPIDILVNVAGVLRPGLIHSLSDEEWEATFSVNSTGVFNASRSVSKYMMDRRSGSIVTVGSNAAGVPRTSMAAYASSKAAAVMFTKCLGLELAEYNIRCNIVSPGSTETDMQWSLWADENGAEQVIKGSLETFKTGIPLKKLAKPSDIADAVLFLVSGQAGHITMHNLCVDGGATLGV